MGQQHGGLVGGMFADGSHLAMEVCFSTSEAFPGWFATRDALAELWPSV
jgi:hypothetical protein